jgi:hypothetical protein
MMAEISDIEALVKKVIEQRLSDDARILSVKVIENDDEDGDSELILRVVFESKSAALDANKVAGLLRHLRPKLHDEIQEDRFPILSFISRKEAETEAA